MVMAGYVFICLVFGTTFMAIKAGLNEGIPPLLMAAIRFGLAGALLLPFLRWRNIPFPQTGRQWLEMAYLGSLMTAVPFAALFWSEQYITSGMASLLVATAPVFIGIMGRMDRTQLTGLLVSFAGIGIVVYHDLRQVENIGAMLAIVLSECAFAYGVIRSKKVLNADVSPQMFNALQMGLASIMLLVMSLMTENTTGFRWTPNMAASILYLSIVASIAASGVYYWLVKITNPMFPTTWTIISPVIALGAGALFLDEPFTWTGAAGTLITLAGIALVNRTLFTALLNAARKRNGLPDPRSYG